MVSRLKRDLKSISARQLVSKEEEDKGKNKTLLQFTEMNEGVLNQFPSGAG